MRTVLPTVRRALRALLLPDHSPVYPPPTFAERAATNLRALRHLLRSREFGAMLLCLVAWVLAGCHLVWWFDVHSAWRYTPLWSSALWLWPWVADARCRCLRKVTWHNLH